MNFLITFDFLESVGCQDPPHLSLKIQLGAGIYTCRHPCIEAQIQSNKNYSNIEEPVFQPHNNGIPFFKKGLCNL